jgi:pilus assembly protein CpaE
MLAGARDFIPKPPSPDQLVATIRFLAGRAVEQEEADRKKIVVPTGPLPGGPKPPRPQGKLIAVYSPKGGVGCTTMATNLALGLNSEDTPTVLIDAALQFGDVAVFLNLQIKNSIGDLAARADELDRDIVEEVLNVHDSGLRVLAAPPRPEMADEITADQLRKVIQHLRHEFAYLVVDTHSHMDDHTLAVLDQTDVLVAVATPDIPAIKDARLLFDLLTVLEFPSDRIFFVLNKMDRKTGITAEAVAENLKQRVDGEVPADEKTVTASINRGVPLLLGDKTKPPAKNMLEVLGSLKQRLVAEPEEEAAMRTAERPKLFSRS